MKFTKTKIKDVFIIDLERKEDERGFLARTWDKEQFQEQGIKTDLVQGYVSHTNNKGTMRGLHYQINPYAENKLTRCTKGKIYEVAVDLRKKSPTYKKWVGFEFSAKDHKMMYIPPNCAHAILIMEDDTDFINFSSQPYTAQYEKGIRYNDPAFKFKWPIKVKYVSPKDMGWPDFKN